MKGLSSASAVVGELSAKIKQLHSSIWLAESCFLESCLGLQRAKWNEPTSMVEMVMIMNGEVLHTEISEIGSLLMVLRSSKYLFTRFIPDIHNVAWTPRFCYFKSNSRSAVVRFWNRTNDFYQKCGLKTQGKIKLVQVRVIFSVFWLHGALLSWT